MARRSQSSACFFMVSASVCSFFSSAIAEATCCLALASCVFMSTISWLSIFSGFSAREIRSLMFDRSRVERRSKSPMSLHLSRYAASAVRCEASASVIESKLASNSLKSRFSSSRVSVSTMWAPSSP